MQLRLRPVKPYKLRVVLCDDQGNQVNDDVSHPEQARAIMETLIRELGLKQSKKKER